MHTILTTGTPLDAALRELGHHVIAVPMPHPGVYSVQSVLETAGLVPDIFIQSELLGKKVLFKDLDTLNCLKVYWSFDTHLNYYWQRHYGALFDVFCTPHKAYIGHLAPQWRHPHTVRLPIPGQMQDWTPHADRAHDAVFVGRVTQFRTARQLFCETLQTRYGIEAHDGLTHEAMLALYAQSRVLPNECIAFETNFRLLEGASCGCCLITPEVGDDQDTLFTPGTEILVYGDMAECLWHIDRCRKDISLTERIGHAAYKRVQREHLPIHRASTLLAACESAARVGLRGNAANSALWCALALLQASEQLIFQDFAKAATQETDDPVTRIYCLLCDAISRNSATDIQQLLAQATQVIVLADNTSSNIGADIAVLCGGAALVAGDAASSHLWHCHYEKALGYACQPVPNTATAACVAWVDSLLRDGKSLLHGLHYCKGRHLSALDMILLLAELDPFGTRWAEAMLAEAHIVHTLPHLALTALAQLSLRRENDIDVSLRYITTALRMFDLEQAQREYDDTLARLPNEPARQSFMRLLRTRTLYSYRPRQLV